MKGNKKQILDLIEEKISGFLGVRIFAFKYTYIHVEYILSKTSFV